MKLTVLLLATTALWGQTATPSITLSAPSGLVAPGSSVTVTATITGTAGNLSMVQDVLTVSSTGTPLTVATPTTIPAKSSLCTTPAAGGGETCLVWGINPAATVASGVVTLDPASQANNISLPDGVAIQTITFTVPANLPSGTINLSVLSPLGVDINGNAVTMTGGSVAITVGTPVTQALAALRAAINVWYTSPNQANLTAVNAAVMALKTAEGN